MIPRKLNVIIHPVSELSNSGTMTPETVQTLLRETFRMMNAGGEITFSFQGPEPTRAGIEFYREFVRLARESCPSGCYLFWSIQTFGLDLDKAWMNLFSKYDFEVSILDPIAHRELDTRKKVRAAIRGLMRREVVVNAVCVLTREATGNPELLYQNLRRLGSRNIVFRPCPDWDSPENENAPTNPMLANFLCRIFEEWLDEWRSGKYVFVNLFDNYIRLLQGKNCMGCTVLGRCEGVVLIDWDGSIYPCEKYKMEAYRIGMLGEPGLEAAIRSSQYQLWLQSGNQKPKECLECSKNRLCNGGCKGDWITDGAGMHHPYCSAYKRFFLYALADLVQISRETKVT